MSEQFDKVFQRGINSLNSRNLLDARKYFEEAIKIDTNIVSAHNNLGITFIELGLLEKAKQCFNKVIQKDPSHAKAYNNIGIIYLQSGNLIIAKEYFTKSIQINPDYVNAHWNLHSLSKTIDDALVILEKILKIDPNFIKAKIIISALEAYNGNKDKLKELNQTSISKHPFMRSVNWLFTLDNRPEIFFNKWNFFDFTASKSISSRPFYEFGVWHGITFKYLINKFKTGYGFDTFTGIPEEWYNESAGHYTSFGKVPVIDGGKFIVGKFEETLPKYFAEKRPVASVINFDADLYSSTLCALDNSKKAIDEKTILIFDEFLMSDKWEEDEYKALKDFCNNNNFEYEVIGVSFFSKQVAVKLKNMNY